MRDHDNGFIGLDQTFEQVDNIGTCFGIKVAGRFIGYNAAIAADPNYALAYAHHCYLHTFQFDFEAAQTDRIVYKQLS